LTSSNRSLRSQAGAFYFTIFVILSSTFFIRSSNNMMVTSTPLLAKYFLGFNQGEIGLVTAISYLTTLVTTSIINVRLSSRERRVAFIVSLATYTAVFIGLYDTNPIAIWFLVALAGASLGMVMPNLITSAGLFEDQKTRERVLSLYTVSLSLSLVVGPAVESYLLKFISLRETFLVFSIFALFATILSPFLAFPEEEMVKEKIRVLSNTGFRSSLINIMSYNIPFTILLAFGGIYEHEKFGAPLSLISVLFSLFFLSSFISRLMISIFPLKRIVRSMMASMVMTALGLVLMISSGNILYFSISLLVLGVPHGLTYPLSILSISRSYGKNERNVANSYFFSFMTGIGIVVSSLGGFLIGRFGYGNVFLGMLLLVVLLFISLNINIRWGKKSPSEV